METRRWTNPSQPQTLQIAVLLLYIKAVFGFIFGSAFVLFGALGLLVVAGYAAAGLGIASERKWGYGLGVGVAAVVLLASVVRFGIIGPYVIGLMFDAALLALLLHPQSRDYQRIWFT